MFLKEYINKIKYDSAILNNRSWLNNSNLIEHIYGDMPSTSTEEWKNFRTRYLKNVSWKIPKKQINNIIEIKEKFKKISNSIIFIDGVYSSDFSTVKKTDGINIFSIQDYIKENPQFKNNLYNDPKKYAEERLSGNLDKRPMRYLYT